MKFKRYMLGAMALSGSVLLFQSGQVAAQGQSASAAAMLEEVVVTARRREENLQDLPLSIQATSVSISFCVNLMLLLKCPYRGSACQGGIRRWTTASLIVLDQFFASS